MNPISAVMLERMSFSWTIPIIIFFAISTITELARADPEEASETSPGVAKESLLTLSAPCVDQFKVGFEKDFEKATKVYQPEIESARQNELAILAELAAMLKKYPIPILTVDEESTEVTKKKIFAIAQHMKSFVESLGLQCKDLPKKSVSFFGLQCSKWRNKKSHFQGQIFIGLSPTRKGITVAGNFFSPTDANALPGDLRQSEIWINSIYDLSKSTFDLDGFDKTDESSRTKAIGHGPLLVLEIMSNDLNAAIKRGAFGQLKDYEQAILRMEALIRLQQNYAVIDLYDSDSLAKSKAAYVDLRLHMVCEPGSRGISEPTEAGKSKPSAQGKRI